MRKTFKLFLLSLVAISCNKHPDLLPISTNTGGEIAQPKLSMGNFALNASPSDTLINLWDFDDATPLHNLTLEHEADSDISIVPDPLDNSNHVMRCRLSPTSYRTEASIVDNSNNLLYFYANTVAGTPDGSSLGSEIWAGGRIYKPSETGLGTIKASIVQVGPVNNPVDFPGLTSSGFSQLRINSSTNKWNWRVFQNSSYTPINYDSDVANLTYGHWETFVIHCKYRSDSQGLIEVWNNGVKTVNITGANAVPNDRVRFKWGVYLGAGNYPAAPITCYFDDIKLGGPNSNYAQVASQNKVVSASADTYVYGGSPGSSYGSSTLLNVKDGGAAQYDRIAYVKFNLTALGFTPGISKLILTTDASTQAGTIYINACAPSPNDWPDASTFTWNSHPSVGANIASVNTTAGVSNQLVIDLSSYVASQYTHQNQIITFALTGSDALMVLKSINNSQGGGPSLSLIK